jgi:hypothetical protein
MLVDTGSSGVRVLSSAFAGLQLPQITSGGNSLTNCTQYADMSYNWGPVALADVIMGGEIASSVPIQIIAAPASNFPSAPTSCSNGGIADNTLDALSANGILGISSYIYDCDAACAPGTTSNAGVYYSCSSASCQVTTAPLVYQLQNPVSLFAADNNGVLITLPSLAASGAPSAAGTLIFGIGTQSDNGLGSATVQTPDASGNISTIFNGKVYSSSFIDSGSNLTYFLDTATTGLPACTDSSIFYCPSSLQNFSATNLGSNGNRANVNFSVANIDTLPAPNWVFDDIAGTSSQIGNINGFPSLFFDWGLPFFFGRTLFVAIEGRSTTGGTGPYWAY